MVFGLAAVAFANGGCEPGTEASSGDTDGDVDLNFDGDGLPTCDGVVVVDTAAGTAQVPGDTSLFASSDSARCALREGTGDEDAVVALQTALSRCHGQNVTMDGEYGDGTARAVTNVQRQHGVAVDGVYGPTTMQAMDWPASSGGCVGGIAPDPAAAAAEPVAANPTFTG